MHEEIIKIITILFFTMFKFIAGPTLGFAAGYPYLGTVAITITGMMSSVFTFTFLGRLLREKVIRKFFPPKKVFTRRSRRFVKIWRKYGIAGVAIFTPLFFTPIGGTLMLSSTGTKKRSIIIYMLISATVWSFIQTGMVYAFGETLLKNLIN